MTLDRYRLGQYSATNATAASNWEIDIPTDNHVYSYLFQYHYDTATKAKEFIPFVPKKKMAIVKTEKRLCQYCLKEILELKLDCHPDCEAEVKEFREEI